MDDPLSRALREDEEEIAGTTTESISSLSISHSHNEWIPPTTNDHNEEAEINREQTRICISDPKKHKSNLDSYVTYLITTQTFNDRVKIDESNVRRRYNDFIWLKTVLDQKYPFNIISPLPAKHTLTKKFHVVADDGEFIRRRMIGLQNFLQRIIDNPVISIDLSVQLFLTAEDESLHSAQQQQPGNSTPQSPTSPAIPSHPFRPPMGRGKPIPSEFTRTESQMQTLQDNLRKIERLGRKLESDQIGVQTEQQYLLSVFKQWLDVEQKHDENPSLITPICDAQQTIVDAETDLSSTINGKFLEPLNEYILFTGVVQDVLKRRTQLSDNVSSNTNASEEMFDQLTIANETIKADIQRWNERKDKELIDLFRSMSNKKVDFYNQSIQAWEQAANQLIGQKK